MAWDDAHTAPGDRYQMPSELSTILSDGKVCNIRAATEYFGRSSRVITSWCKAGFLPSVRIGGRFYFLVSDLVEIGMLYTIDETAREVGFSPKQVVEWIKSGFLPATIACGRRYIREPDVVRLREVVGWLTTNEAADELGIRCERVTWHVRKGHLTGVKTSLGYRFDPTEVARFKLTQAPDEESEWRASRVKQELGISETALLGWSIAGAIRSRLVGQNVRIYNASDVMRVKGELTALHEAFAWLQSDVGLQTRTYTANQVCRKLDRKSVV